jgi:flagellar protein FlbD
MNESSLVVNADLIEFVEAIPETSISLTTGKKLMVRESVNDIIRRVAQFRQQCDIRLVSTDGSRAYAQE